MSAVAGNGSEIDIYLKHFMESNNHSSRRKFIQQTSLAGTGLMLASPLQIFSQAAEVKNIKSRVMLQRMLREN